jgi:hypothetical protein
MDSAEEIVAQWLLSKGFFIMPDVPCAGRKQIDFLAMNPANGKKAHVEVHVSTEPAHPLRGTGDQKYAKRSQRLTEFYLSKFIGRLDHSKEGEVINHTVEETVRSILHCKDYERLLVIGKLKMPKDKEELENGS